jgi:DNA primase
VAGLFSQATLDQIRAANDIVDVIGGYLPLKRAGANFLALCPFHKEKTPSFNVNPRLQIFRCFGCQKGGNVFGFVMAYENLDFPEAVRRLAERAKIPLQYDNNPVEQQSRHIKDKLLQVHEQITQRWQNALANEASGQIARDYLARRAVPQEAVNLFRLGYAPEVWDDSVNWGKSKGYDAELMEKAGLILRKEGSDHYYDRFRGRLMFPICDEQGRVVGFSGRILSGDEKVAKYVNSPETPIFTKSRVFFGLDKSKRALLDADCAIICEGQLDLITCFMAGVQNIVAPQGTALTADHARILKRYVNEVVLCFDSDEAGQNAAVRSLDHLLASGLAARVAVVPPPHDPDSFVKALGGDAFKTLIQKAAGFFDYYLERLCATNPISADKGQLAVLRDMAEAVQKTDNAVLVDKYAQKTALRLGVSPEAVLAEFRKNKPARPVRDDEEQAQEQPRSEPPNPTERWLLKLLFVNEDLLDWAAAHLRTDWLQHTGVKQIVARRIMVHNEQTWHGLAAFLDEDMSQESRDLITEAAAEGRPIPNPAQQLIDITLRLRNQFLDQQLATLLQKASQPQTAEPEKLELLRQQQEVRARKRAPLAR